MLFHERGPHAPRQLTSKHQQQPARFPDLPLGTLLDSQLSPQRQSRRREPNHPPWSEDRTSPGRTHMDLWMTITDARLDTIPLDHRFTTSSPDPDMTPPRPSHPTSAPT